ncbi:MAG: heavy metal-associated domain-containing protein [Acholeplasmataceae bacterium]
MKEIIIQLETLTCPSCIKRIEKGIKGLKDIDQVVVLFNSSRVKVKTLINYDSNLIVNKINNLGYQVLNVKEN